MERKSDEIPCIRLPDEELEALICKDKTIEENFRSLFDFFGIDEYEYMFFLGKSIKHEILAVIGFTSYLNDYVWYDVEKTLTKMLNNEVDLMYMAHNHPDEDTYPSNTDINSTKKDFADALKHHIFLRNHFIYNKEGHVGIINNPALNIKSFQTINRQHAFVEKDLANTNIVCDLAFVEGMLELEDRMAYIKQKEELLMKMFMPWKWLSP